EPARFFQPLELLGFARAGGKADRAAANQTNGVARSTLAVQGRSDEPTKRPHVLAGGAGASRQGLWGEKPWICSSKLEPEFVVGKLDAWRQLAVRRLVVDLVAHMR